MRLISVIRFVLSIQEVIIEQSIKLVILDSIASIVRKEFDNNSSDKSSLLLEQASILKEVAEGFNIPVGSHPKFSKLIIFTILLVVFSIFLR